MAKIHLYSRLDSDEITTCGYMVLTFAKCTTIMIAELVGLGTSFDKMVWCGMIGMVLV
jgi:hypothetical protein